MNVVAYVAAVRDMEGVLDHISVSACQLVESRGVSRTESRVGVLGATVPSAFQADASVDLWPLPTVVDLHLYSPPSISIYTTMLTLGLHFPKPYTITHIKII